MRTLMTLCARSAPVSQLHVLSLLVFCEPEVKAGIGLLQNNCLENSLFECSLTENIQMIMAIG